MTGELKADASEAEKTSYQALNAEKAELKRQLNELLDKIADKVLDKDLFLREAKHTMLLAPLSEKKKFYEILAKKLENGESFEIIDGDTDTIERSSFAAAMEWIQELKNM